MSRLQTRLNGLAATATASELKSRRQFSSANINLKKVCKCNILSSTKWRLKGIYKKIFYSRYTNRYINLIILLYSLFIQFSFLYFARTKWVFISCVMHRCLFFFQLLNLLLHFCLKFNVKVVRAYVSLEYIYIYITIKLFGLKKIFAGNLFFCFSSSLLFSLISYIRI